MYAWQLYHFGMKITLSVFLFNHSSITLLWTPGLSCNYALRQLFGGIHDDYGVFFGARQTGLSILKTADFL